LFFFVFLILNSCAVAPSPAKSLLFLYSFMTSFSRDIFLFWVKKK
jgi:hypothetical protein